MDEGLQNLECRNCGPKFAHFFSKSEKKKRSRLCMACVKVVNDRKYMRPGAGPGCAWRDRHMITRKGARPGFSPREEFRDADGGKPVKTVWSKENDGVKELRGKR